MSERRLLQTVCTLLSSRVSTFTLVLLTSAARLHYSPHAPLRELHEHVVFRIISTYRRLCHCRPLSASNLPTWELMLAGRTEQSMTASNAHHYQ